MTQQSIEEQTAELEAKTKPELIELAEDIGAEYSDNFTKPSLIDAIIEARAEANDADDDTFSHIEVSEDFLNGIDLNEVADELRDEILSWFKSPTVKPWKDLNESEQRSLASNVQNAVREVIVKTAKEVGGAGFEYFQGHVEQVTVKDDIKLVIKSNNDDDNYSAAGRVRGSNILILNVDAKAYAESRKAAQIDPDQPTMIAEADGTVKTVAEAMTEHMNQEG